MNNISKETECPNLLKTYIDSGKLPSTEVLSSDSLRPLRYEPPTKEWFGDFHIEKATTEDAFEISALIQTNFLFHPNYSDMPSRIKADYLRANNISELRQTLEKPNTFTWIVKQKGFIAAVLVTRIMSSDDVYKRFQNKVVLSPSKQALDIRRLHTRIDCTEGLGLGSELLRHAEKDARQRSLSMLVSDAAAPAKSFFEKFGFLGDLVPVDRKNGSRSQVYRCYRPL